MLLPCLLLLPLLLLFLRLLLLLLLLLQRWLLWLFVFALCPSRWSLESYVSIRFDSNSPSQSIKYTTARKLSECAKVGIRSLFRIPRRVEISYRCQTRLSRLFRFCASSTQMPSARISTRQDCLIYSASAASAYATGLANEKIANTRTRFG